MKDDKVKGKPGKPSIPSGRPPGPASKTPVKPPSGVRPAPPSGGAQPRPVPTATAAFGVAAGAAMAAGAMSEEMRYKLDTLQSKFGGLQEAALLTRAHTEMADLQTALSLLPAEIEKLRTRGYAFRSYLENKIGVLAQQWDEIQQRVSVEVTRRTQELQRDSDVAEGALRQAMSGHPTQVSGAESAINVFESKVKAAQSAIEGMYAPLRDNINQTRAQVEEIEWLLDQIDEATFQLHPGEDAVLACKAQYMESEKDGPEGVLYLTDGRLIFERKEEVATKKVLFITTAKETVQELIFDVPIGQVEEAKASDEKKFLGHKEMLQLLFAPAADLSGATLRLLGGAQNEEWARMINRVKTGEIDKERARPKDQAAVEAAQAAPTKCPTCGATLSVSIVRGMREITCEYCGSVIRL